MAQWKRLFDTNNIEYWRFTSSSPITLVRDANVGFIVKFDKKSKSLGFCDLETAMYVGGQFAISQIDEEMKRLSDLKDVIFDM